MGGVGHAGRCVAGGRVARGHGSCVRVEGTGGRVRRVGRRSGPSASAAGGGGAAGEDPYAVLGVTRFATTEQLAGARKKLLVGCGGDAGCEARVEGAYDRIVAAQLALRMAGGDRLGLSVSKGFRFGDASWMPAWGPRVDPVGAEALKLNAGVFGALVLWGVLSSMAGTQPTMWSSVFAFFRVNAKVPPAVASGGGDGRNDTLEEKMVPIRRLLRVLGLVFAPVAVGVFLIAFLPIAFMNLTGLAIPLTFLTRRDLLITCVVCALQFYTCSFLR